MNPTIKQLYWELTVLRAARQLLAEKYLTGDGAAKEPLICEELGRANESVGVDVIADMILRMEASEKLYTDRLARFVTREEDVKPIISQEAAPGPKHPAVGKGGKPRGKSSSAS